MAELSDAAKAGMGYYGVIEHAAREGLGTAATWDLIRAEAQTLGLTSPGISASAVSELRARAVATQRTEGIIAAAGDNISISREHLTDAPWARSIGEQAGAPKWQVRFEHITEGPNGTETNWRTVMLKGTEIPDTFGDLRDTLEVEGEEMANDYGLTHGGIGAIQILVV